MPSRLEQQIRHIEIEDRAQVMFGQSFGKVVCLKHEQIASHV